MVTLESPGDEMGPRRKRRVRPFHMSKRRIAKMPMHSKELVGLLDSLDEIEARARFVLENCSMRQLFIVLADLRKTPSEELTDKDMGFLAIFSMAEKMMMEELGGLAT